MSFPHNKQFKAGLYKAQKSGASPSHLSSSTSPSHQQPLFSCEAGEKGRVCDAWIEFILLCQCYGPHQEGGAVLMDICGDKMCRKVNLMIYFYTCRSVLLKVHAISISTCMYKHVHVELHIYMYMTLF